MKVAGNTRRICKEEVVKDGVHVFNESATNAFSTVYAQVNLLLKETEVALVRLENAEVAVKVSYSWGLSIFSDWAR